MEREILYFADPMCSWCYGFGPELEMLSEKLKDKVKVKVVPGGLHPYEDRVTTDRTANEIMHHWIDVNKATGKQFDFDFFKKNKDFIYETAPACKAVVAVKKIDPVKAQKYLSRLQEKFYLHAKSPTSMSTFEEAAKELDIPIDEFREKYNSEASEEELQRSFEFTRSLAIFGFPSVYLKIDDQYHLISQGYVPFKELERRILSKIGE